MELRISAGKYKNRRLSVPASARPVRERIKLAIFSILGDDILNKDCLDLFSGSGNLGLEALSRGAKSCVFVDYDYNSIQSIIENTAKLGIQAEIVKEDATKYVTNIHAHYDI